MQRFRKLFGPNQMSVIGMIHVDPLPGTPKYSAGLDTIIEKAKNEAEIYLRTNVDGILVENMNDIPYVQARNLEPETTAIMTRICMEIKNIVRKNCTPCGVQVLAGGNKEALAIASACNFDFIRAEGFVFSHVADEGFTDATAGTLLRYRKKIDADNILVFADIKKKHSSHAITNDISLVETAKAADFFLADGVILTGTATGSAADETELTDLKRNLQLPVLVGSGITHENVNKYFHADAMIVGSYFKHEGHWRTNIDERKVEQFMDKVNCLRHNS